MRSTSRIISTGAALGMLLLILDSRTALDGARGGLELCLKTVIPSLFPFIVLSNLLINTLGSDTPRYLRSIGGILGIPRGCESIFLTGCVGGYPVGSVSIAQAVEQGRLSHSDGERMMAFCNNPGPAFIFGIAGSMFDNPWTGWALWGIQLAGAVLVGMLLPGKSRKITQGGNTTRCTISTAMTASIRSMAVICSWVVLFRVILSFLDRWLFWLLPATVRIIFSGLLELTNGCCMLRDILNPALRFIICTGLLSFGGICVGMQTASAAKTVPLRLYFPGKLLQCVISVLLAYVAVTVLPGIFGSSGSPVILPGILITAGLLIFFLGKMQNRGRISGEIGV